MHRSRTSPSFPWFCSDGLLRPAAFCLILTLLMPFRGDRRGQGIQVRERRHRRPDFFIRNILPGRVFAEFPIPLEHPRISHPAFDDPEQLIIRLARRMQSKHRRTWIERVFGFALSGIARIAMAARAIALEQFHPRQSPPSNSLPSAQSDSQDAEPAAPPPNP